MSNPTEIIIYRNPLEHAFWNSGMLFPLLCAMVAMFVTFIVVADLTERMGAYSKLRGYIIIGSGILTGIITFNWLSF